MARNTILYTKAVVKCCKNLRAKNLINTKPNGKAPAGNRGSLVLIKEYVYEKI